MKVKFKRFRLYTLTQGENRGIVGILNVRKLRLTIIIIIIHILYITAVYLVPQKSTVSLTKHIFFIVPPKTSNFTVCNEYLRLSALEYAA
jgi:hypothetical protein